MALRALAGGRIGCGFIMAATDEKLVTLDKNLGNIGEDRRAFSFCVV